jgi:hypothetical protein
MWYESSTYHTPCDSHNLRKKPWINMIIISFCRASKTSSICDISFHIGSTEEKKYECHGCYLIYSKVIDFFNSFSLRKNFFAFSKKQNKSTEIYRNSSSIILNYWDRDPGGWQIFDLIRRCPFSFDSTP